MAKSHSPRVQYIIELQLTWINNAKEPIFQRDTCRELTAKNFHYAGVISKYIFLKDNVNIFDSYFNYVCSNCKYIITDGMNC